MLDTHGNNDRNNEFRMHSLMNKIAHNANRLWPEEDLGRIPYWIYTDQQIFDKEMERIFCGPGWAYVGLAVELPEPGAYLTTFIGNQSVVICRNRDGELRGFVVLIEASSCAAKRSAKRIDSPVLIISGLMI